TLTGDGESNSPGTGTGSVLFNSATDTLTVALAFIGLTSPTAIPAGVPGAAHIHFGNPGVEGPILFPFIEPNANNFPLDVTSGTYVTTLTAASLIPDPADGINTFAEAVNAIEAGHTYFNIHTVAFPGGEIRGQITVIPEPASLTLLTLGLGGILAIAQFGRRLVA
ncbi:MAG: CHRD domain-containing protein, partial [Isosphaeraceae bacterium]